MLCSVCENDSQSAKNDSLNLKKVIDRVANQFRIVNSMPVLDIIVLDFCKKVQSIFKKMLENTECSGFHL